jgi:hypothetical protein
VATDKYAGHRGAQKVVTGQLEDRWQPVTRRVCCANPKTSDPALLPRLIEFEKTIPNEWRE